MKIEKVEPILLTLPSKWAYGTLDHCFSFIRVTTDSGLVGYGETLLGYYTPDLVPTLVNHFRGVVEGQNPFEINRLWQDMHVKAVRWGHVGPAITVLGAIEIALWDILGKALQTPVYQLLGGLAHERMRCYGSAGGGLAYPIERSLDYFKKLTDQGFTAIKVGQGYFGQEPPTTISALVDLEREKIEAVRKALGDDIDLMMDPAAPFSRAPWSGDVALRVTQAIDPYHLLWMEQPVLQTNVDDYVRIRQICSTPLAAGENGTTLHDLKPFFEKRAIDVAQPDSIWCGGISECMKMVAAAEAHDMRVAPHCFSGAVGMAANYHVAFASRAIFIVEYPTASNPVMRNLLEQTFRFEDGYLYPPDTPGLGIEIPAELIEKYPLKAGSGRSHAKTPFPRPFPRGWNLSTESDRS